MCFCSVSDQTNCRICYWHWREHVSAWTQQLEICQSLSSLPKCDILCTYECFYLIASNLQRFSDVCNTEVPAMKPDPLDAAVVNHRMDDCTVQQRANHSEDTETTKDKHSPSSPRNSDVIFEAWDMVSIFWVQFTWWSSHCPVKPVSKDFPSDHPLTHVKWQMAIKKGTWHIGATVLALTILMRGLFGAVLACGQIGATVLVLDVSVLRHYQTEAGAVVTLTVSDPVIMKVSVYFLYLC